MTADDLKLHKWYIEDNGWNKLWFYGINRNKWIIYDPESSGAIFKTDEISDDGFEVSPPKIADNQSKLTKEFIIQLFEENLDVML